MPRLRTNVTKALHQVKRGRRKITARDFNQEIRDHMRIGPTYVFPEMAPGSPVRDDLR